MSSQTSSQDLDSPIEIPTTPQPLGTELPSHVDLPNPRSPTTSLMVAGSSSDITPPPSTQAPKYAVSPLRSITPDAMIPSSPPPTITNGTRMGAVKSTTSRPTIQQIESATSDQLREMVKMAWIQVSKLEAQNGEARMSAAHYKLQHNLLTIESEEALKRMEVELFMARREVEHLQQSPRDPANANYLQKLRDWCKSVEEDNALTYRRLEKAKKVIEAKDEKLKDAQEEIARLCERIRQNREHINVMRSPGGPLHISTPKTGPTTPQQYRGTPRYAHTPNTGRSTHYRHEHPRENQEKFNALLLAGSILNQENNSAPSTPQIHRRADPRTPSRHNRGVQSLSSLPATPGSGRPITSNSALLPSAQFSPEAEARMITHSRERARRRKSRDSTISASDTEEIARAVRQYRDESEEVQESQASQTASEMLRIDPRESFEVAASRGATPTEKTLQAQHGKIFGNVTKRKAEVDYPEVSKKIRTSEGVGLGIGYEVQRV